MCPMQRLGMAFIIDEVQARIEYDHKVLASVEYLPNRV